MIRVQFVSIIPKHRRLCGGGRGPPIDLNHILLRAPIRLGPALYRSRRDQIQTYKIISGINDTDCTEGLFEMREDDTTPGNTRKIYKTRARLDLRNYSFPHRVVNNWNNLPEWV